ncbi:hypothetical protein OWR28_02445 [Chryseobacterium sp. 1B4]
MKTKYIKVSVADRLPEKEGRYFLWVDNPNARNLNSQKLSTEYNMERHFFKNGEFQTFYDTTHYLEEVPDYEEEMKEVLSMALNRLENTTEYEVVDFYKEDCDKIRNFLNK